MQLNKMKSVKNVKKMKKIYRKLSSQKNNYNMNKKR